MKLPDDWQTNEYGSHWHLLTEVVTHFKPKRILETGSGLYSTNLLLSFDIERLVSLENNPDWQRRPRDPRHELRRVEGPVADSLPPLDDFDLVFVDDDPVVARERTIRRVLAEAPGLVVIHDADHDAYARIIKDRHKYVDKTHVPHTAVLHPTPNKEFDKWLATSSQVPAAS